MFRQMPSHTHCRTRSVKSKWHWPVASPALPNPEKQSQPCPGLELLSPIHIPFFSPDPHKGCSERQERGAGVGLCQASQGPSWLINNCPWSCIYLWGWRRGGCASCRPLSLLAWFMEHPCLGFKAWFKEMIFIPAELQVFKGVFPQKMRWAHPNHPVLRASATKSGLGKGIDIHNQCGPCQINQMLLGRVVLARRGLLFECQQGNMHMHVVFLTCSLIARGFSVV